MAKEVEGYRDTLARIRDEAAGELVTVDEAARITGLPKRRVTQVFTGWTAQGRDKRIAAPTLARQIVGA